MGITIKALADALGATAFGDTDRVVDRPAEPSAAGPSDLALAMTPAWAEALIATTAEAAIVWQGADWQAMGLKAGIEVGRARLAMAKLTQALDEPPVYTGVHPTAIIDPSVHIEPDVSIGAFCVIGAGTRIAAGTCIDAHVSIAPNVTIGTDGIIHGGVRIGRNVDIGARVVLQPNVVIGADGFSFVTQEPSNEERAFRGMGRTPLDPPQSGTRHRIHSLGSVVMGDDIEVGANSTIDAGTIRPTRVGSGTKIDNLVQVGHNVILGRDCVLCAQAAVAGSAVLGDRVVMGGKSGIKDNVTVGHDVVLGGGALVLASVDDGQFMMGYPALPMPSYRNREKALRKLAQRQKPVSKPG